MENTPRTRRTTCRATCRSRVASPPGENIVTLDASSSVWPFKARGQAGGRVVAADETPVFTLTAASSRILRIRTQRSSTSPFLAKEQQAKLGSFSSRADSAAGGASSRSPRTRSPTTTGVHDRRQAGRGVAQAHGGLHRPAGEQGWGEVGTRSRRSERAKRALPLSPLWGEGVRAEAEPSEDGRGVE